MFIGIVIFIIVILIISLIYKLKNKYYKKKIKPLKIDLNYKNIIKDNKLIYINKYKNLQIKEKLTGIGNIMLNMMEDISMDLELVDLKSCLSICLVLIKYSMHPMIVRAFLITI